MNGEEKHDVSVHLLPEMIPVKDIAKGVAVVIDVLRATTVIVHALAAGAREVRPCLTVEDAQSLREELGPDATVLGGERGGLPISGFDLGNSPREYTPALCQDKIVILTTTNGTKAILASESAAKLYIGALVNLRMTLNGLIAANKPVHLVCSGTTGQISYEDTLTAGAIARGLIRLGWKPANDEALIASQLWHDVESRVDEEFPLARFLHKGQGGRNLQQLGLGADVERSSKLDQIDLIAELVKNPLRIVRAPLNPALCI